MSLERTLSIIKPDAVAKNDIGAIIARFEQAKLQVLAAKMLHLTEQQAMEFYAVHRERPFYLDLVRFMTSGPVLVLVLSGENAIEENRRIMGATDPKKAAPGTIRIDFGRTVEENAVHGSDSPENAATEIRFFFRDDDICPRTR